METKTMDEIWQNLYKVAINALNPKEISCTISAGEVASAIYTSSLKIYVGVCVDTACSLGVCAERNALFNALTNNESEVLRIVTVDSTQKVLSPCGACREFICQLMPQHYKNVEIMLDYTKPHIVKLGDLMPHFWL